MKLYLIDGTWELFRHYFAVPFRKNERNEEVAAVTGLVRNILSLLQTDPVTHVAVAFDTVIESFRNEMFEGYKTGDGIDPNLLSQFPLAEAGIEALGVTTWCMVEYEADDALHTASRRWADSPGVERILICSPDKDFAQSVRGRRTVCLNRRTSKILDEDGVWRKFGVAPESIPDYLALVGDSADGIPGLRGWGRKSASSILATYRHLEDIPSNPARWKVSLAGKERLAAALVEHLDDVLLFRELATLRDDVPLEEGLQDLEWKGPDLGSLDAFGSRVESQFIFRDG